MYCCWRAALYDNSSCFRHTYLNTCWSCLLSCYLVQWLQSVFKQQFSLGWWNAARQLFTTPTKKNINGIVMKNKNKLIFRFMIIITCRVLSSFGTAVVFSLPVPGSVRSWFSLCGAPQDSLVLSVWQRSGSGPAWRGPQPLWVQEGSESERTSQRGSWCSWPWGGPVPAPRSMSEV